MAGFLLTPEMEFRKETIYFIVIDRFFNSCLGNDRVGRDGLFDPGQDQWGHYWGGDLRGVIEKADYLQALGVTALWLSPLFEQVDDQADGWAPMHGYWTRDFKRLNPHFIAPDDSTSLQHSRTLQHLVETFHGRGIRLILDIVCNHSSPEINGSKGVVYDDGVLLADFNHDSRQFYHHYGSITDWNDEFQLIHHEMMGLATFNEANIEYRNYIKSAITAWLDAGFDGLRVDTIKHMPLWFWQEFVSDLRRVHPETFIFGEYGFGSPHDSRTLSYANRSGMSILDFGLAYAIRAAFSGGEPGGFHQVQALLELDHVYKRATELVTFIDNHDMPRFLSVCNDQQCLELAVILLLTLRGIPCLFYGTEQSLVNHTQGGQDPYNRPMMATWDEQGTLFRAIRALADLRRTNRALAYGSHQANLLTDTIFAFTRRYRESRVFTLLNKGEAATISLDHLDFPSGEHRCLLSGVIVHVEAGAIRHLELPAKAARVLSVVGPPVEGSVVVKFQLNNFFTRLGQVVVVCGDAPELGGWDLRRAPRLEYVNADTWFSEVAFDESAGQPICFRFVVVWEGAADPADGACHENLLPRRFILPANGRVKLDHDWESF
ncbi:MAG: alpha-amylase family glycosyl hydrolase [Cyanobacteriota bacterium]|nr:alpha-amylase family glycosyl hydrolase [Cyanobacteriota bacterium]